MEIRILGPGCPRCHEVEKRTLNVLAQLGVAADVQKISDIIKFLGTEFALLRLALTVPAVLIRPGHDPTPDERCRGEQRDYDDQALPCILALFRSGPGHHFHGPRAQIDVKGDNV